MRTKETTIYDSDSGLDYDSYKEYLSANDLTEHQLSLSDFIETESRYYYEDFMDSLRSSVWNNYPCVITGTLGLWNGTFTVKPVKCMSLTEAVKKCWSRSIERIVVKQAGGHLIVEAYHHDGCNRFEVHLLNEKGYRTRFGDLSKKMYHKAIRGNVLN